MDNKEAINSKKLIKSHPIPRKPATPPGEIVLREWENGQWATHFHNTESGGYYFGHYFDLLDDAITDFNERVQQWGGKEA